MNTPVSEEVLRQRLREVCKAEGSQRAWALRHGLSRSFVTDVLKGRTAVTERLAETLGFRRESVFYPIAK